MKLAEAFGHVGSPLRYAPSAEWALPSCRIGLEWEWENGGALAMLMNGRAGAPYLDAKNDGSLRDNGIEIVTRGDGLFGEDLAAAIATMEKLYQQAKPTTGYRTAFHVHIDIRDMEALEVHNLLLLYCLLEKPIFNFVGKGRENSNFCVPWFRSEAQFGVFQQIAKPGFDNHIAIKQLQRYSALNVQAIAKLGTVEFRHMENDGKEINTKQVAFINLIMRIKELALKFAREGVTGERLYTWAKRITAQELLNQLKFPLSAKEWDYTDSLMSASLLVPFEQKSGLRFADALFIPFCGTTHPRWR